MALRQTKVRFDPEAYEFVAAQAAYLGVSISEFCRTAAMFRASVTWARHHPERAKLLDDALETASRQILDEADPLDGRGRST